jgi:EAL domain-containing protein (putative c-di-GMP-specific phosphodiesterase class I)
MKSDHADISGRRVRRDRAEAETQLETLNRMGCQHAQGFHLSPPLTADAMLDAVLRADLDSLLAPGKN